LCMDIGDRAADAVSLMHRINPAPLAVVAFLVQLGGLALLLVQGRRTMDFFVALVMALVLAASGVSWFSLKNHKVARRLMKFQLFVGLYFLT
jgi:hypothetical protein